MDSAPPASIPGLRNGSQHRANQKICYLSHAFIMGCVAMFKDAWRIYRAWWLYVTTGNHRAAIALARLYVDCPPPFKSAQRCLKAAEAALFSGDPEAFYLAGKAQTYQYATGAADESVFHKGLDRLLTASERGSGEASYLLGDLFQNKQTPVYDLEMSLRSFKVASDQGNLYANAKISFFIYNGIVVEKDEPLAMRIMIADILENRGNRYIEQLNAHNLYAHLMINDFSAEIVDYYKTMNVWNYVADAGKWFQSNQNSGNLEMYKRENFA
ncbi:hypothetical protein SI859A1_00925 [Aurantimonas manganoxydans SI85-9A1]|uniref:Uncharacterized protein n=2 Tax=Aurantimonas manganoxydans TaxID=651183 RepID=Q1YJS3_AURMS|nr:hypothetical protein SI859A1_00925 [Aurantimonas manganoxydans SI85-9A1]